MDSCLTQQIPISLPPWRKYSAAPKIAGYSNVSGITPILGKFFGKLPDSEGQIHSDELFGKVSTFQGSGPCIVETVARKKRDSFCKVTHLLEPIRSIQGYYVDPVKGERRRAEKLNNPSNQAYVDGLASYLLGQLRERKISPHFCIFYGAFQGVAESYRYNITSEFESYRRYKMFWQCRRSGLFSLHIENSEEFANTPKSSLRSGKFNYSTPCADDRSVVSLDGEVELDGTEGGVELESVGSMHTASEDESESDDEDDDDDEDDETEDELSVFVELKDTPVMMIFQERMSGVLDHMLEDDGTLVGAEPGTEEAEARWIAWTFQIIAALCAAQGALGFTHNDLHTNNIVWKETEESWLWYKSRDGTVWRVPTYGKIFCLIDFGRSIFRVGEEWFISDDYERGGDAHGQYNFGPTVSKEYSVVYPNPSFDLCRYAVSILDALYDEEPVQRLDGAVLSKEGKWTIYETESPFWNLLWSWMIDDRGRNILREEDGTERFPDFDLYEHISAHVHTARPQDQIHKDIFKGYQIDPKNVGDWETIYPLFC